MASEAAMKRAMGGPMKRKRTKRVQEVYLGTLKECRIKHGCALLESIHLDGKKLKVGDRVRVTVERLPQKKGGGRK
jgi:hypothetical protein